VVGVGLAGITARLASSLLIGVSALDTVAFGGTTLFVLIIVAAASLLPSWRAARTDAAVALRHL
jgi:ABC-type lipoprotein release transport system permease subunit